MAWMINSTNDKFFITVTGEKKNEQQNYERNFNSIEKKGALSLFYSSSKFEFLDFGIFSLSFHFIYIYSVAFVYLENGIVKSMSEKRGRHPKIYI